MYNNGKGVIFMTKDELIKQQIKKIESSRNKKMAAQEVVKTVESLTYSKSGKKISNKDIKEILKKIKEGVTIIIGEFTDVVKATDADDYITTLDAAISRIENLD